MSNRGKGAKVSAAALACSKARVCELADFTDILCAMYGFRRCIRSMVREFGVSDKDYFVAGNSGHRTTQHVLPHTLAPRCAYLH
jgi:hypothetical protein